MNPNRQTVTQGLDYLQAALAPFIARELGAKFRKTWWTQGVYYAVPTQIQVKLPKDGDEHDLARLLDVAALLSLLERNWNEVFAAKLTRDDRTYANEIRSTRNKWAHHGGGDLSEDDAWRALDTITRLLEHIHPETAATTAALAKTVRQPVSPPAAPAASVVAPEQAPAPKRAAKARGAQATLALALRPWRDVVQPHPDVAAGRYQQAEFAADLAQVLAGKAELEYQDPAEFFGRTFLTEGMRILLATALARLGGQGGEPVVQLKTAFGGGKTHTMLALFHLVRAGTAAPDLPGVADVLTEANVGAEALPAAKVAVLVGTALDATQARLDKGGHGVTVRTLWGELAAQLGGAEAFGLVQQADEAGVSPGADTLVEVFDRFGPAVVLIDELVAYARNIYGVEGLPGGSFDSTMTFVQSLTEAAKRSQRSMVVASIPESDVEIGGDAGKAAQERMEQTFGRLEAVWKPVGAREGFEIVRRRLFGEVSDEAARDEACRQFAKLYGDSTGDFPREAGEVEYLDRLRSAYPIHPEVFDHLYSEWSSLERFQRTRGVLRLMAGVIHALWVRQDHAVMILPGNLPLDDPNVRNELTRYLPEGWNAVIDKDVDGERSEPLKIDGESPRFGQYAAARRMARAIFLGSAPHVTQQRVRGVEATRIRLGVAQPNEPIAVFNDALGRLGDRLTYLYAGDGRYWYDTRPNLRRTAEDKAAALEEYRVTDEIERRLRQVRDRGDFAAVHVFTESGDVPDDPASRGARLVVLKPGATHKQNRKESGAIRAAAEILDKRGSSPRLAKNTLVFVAPDEEGVVALGQAVRQYLAWTWIGENTEELNLDAHGNRQAREMRQRWDQTVDARLQETYAWLLVPYQEGAGPWEWDISAIRSSSGNSHVARAASKLRSTQGLISKWSPALLKMELDRWLWKDRDHYETKKLWDALTHYGYLPRLASERVLLEAIAEGLRSQDYFGYASSVSPEGRYEGLVFGTGDGGLGSVQVDGLSVLVKPAAAIRQLEGDEAAQRARQEQLRAAQSAAVGREDGRGAVIHEDGGAFASQPGVLGPAGAAAAPQPVVLRRFFGSVELDPERIIRDAPTIANEVVQHLTGLPGARVRVTLEIEAELPDGAPEHVVRTVTENSTVLKFGTSGFEEA